MASPLRWAHRRSPDSPHARLQRQRNRAQERRRHRQACAGERLRQQRCPGGDPDARLPRRRHGPVHARRPGATLAPNPRVRVGGQPAVNQTAPYTVAGCTLPHLRRERAVRNRPVGHRLRAGALERGALVAAGQPGDMRPTGTGLNVLVATQVRVRVVMHIDYPFHLDIRGRTATADQGPCS